MKTGSHLKINKNTQNYRPFTENKLKVTEVLAIMNEHFGQRSVIYTVLKVVSSDSFDEVLGGFKEAVHAVS
jgi:hypothetical protein